ncbi:hypothetical protein HK102_006420 [Quaeritorhiza haematococci]|nr:hypothetical protein HK102_006420 [Quaeritorhiza haematococci]
MAFDHLTISTGSFCTAFVRLMIVLFFRWFFNLSDLDPPSWSIASQSVAVDAFPQQQSRIRQTPTPNGPISSAGASATTTVASLPPTPTKTCNDNNQLDPVCQEAPNARLGMASITTRASKSTEVFLGLPLWLDILIAVGILLVSFLTVFCGIRYCRRKRAEKHARPRGSGEAFYDEDGHSEVQYDGNGMELGAGSLTRKYTGAGIITGPLPPPAPASVSQQYPDQVTEQRYPVPYTLTPLPNTYSLTSQQQQQQQQQAQAQGQLVPYPYIPQAVYPVVAAPPQAYPQAGSQIQVPLPAAGYKVAPYIQQEYGIYQ